MSLANVSDKLIYMTIHNVVILSLDLKIKRLVEYLNEALEDWFIHT